MNMRSAGRAIVAAMVVVLLPACAAGPAPLSEAVLVLESDSGKGGPTQLVVVELSGRELVRRSTETVSEVLPTLHTPTAQVAFWRQAGGSGFELVIWKISTNALTVLAAAALAPAAGPIWSLDGTQVVTLHTNEVISYLPGADFNGRAELSVVTIATGQYRILAAEAPFMPVFADGAVIGGESIRAEKRYVVVDAGTGRTLRQQALGETFATFATADPDVVLTVHATRTAGKITLHQLNVRTGVDLTLTGEVFGGPSPSWPGRREVVFVADGELRAFDYTTNQVRVVGPVGGVRAALGFDDRGEVLLVARVDQPFYGTFAAAGGRLTSALRVIPIDPSVGRSLGLTRITK